MRKNVALFYVCVVLLACTDSTLHPPVELGDEVARLSSVCEGAPVLGQPGSSSSSAFEITFNAKPDEGWSRSDAMLFRVPPDLIGISMSVDSDAATGFGYVANNGNLLFDMGADPLQVGVPPYFHVLDTVSTLAFPLVRSDALEEGCLALMAVADEDLDEAQATLHIASKRGQGDGILVNAIVVGSTVVEEQGIRDAFEKVSEVFQDAEVASIGQMNIVRLEWDAEFPREAQDAASDRLTSTYVGDDERALNVYFIQDYGLFSGAASGVPAPVLLHGTKGSGIIVSVDTHLDAANGELDAVYLAQTLAHEIGHHVGLRHVTEASGRVFDSLADTPECRNDENGDGLVFIAECMGMGGDNLMFWSGRANAVKTKLSSDQRFVFGRSPLLF